MDEWYSETFDGHTRLSLRVKERLFSGQSEFQKVEVIDTFGFGRVLVVDGVFMTSEYDEFLYHEMLVHPAMTTAPRIDRVLVIGGGDGGTVREVLRYPEVRECVMIEIDEMVVDASKQYLQTIGTAWDDPRLDLRFIDGIDYVKTSSEPKFDVVLIDGTDPIGPGAVLFEEDFFAGCKRMLAEDGVMALQSESPLLMMDAYKTAQEKLRRLFEEVHPYLGPVPLYATGTWSWTWCANEGTPLSPIPSRQSQVTPHLRAYNPPLHPSLFTLPTYAGT